MSLTKKEYLKRLIDKKIDDYLEIFGAISIEGPKWCGKTWTSLNHSNSVFYLDDENTMKKANLSLELILNDKKPILIDEWNIVPKIWDGVRHKCDETTNKGNYILTCSTKLTDELEKEKIHHSGAGRIGIISMQTMSLYESGDSTGLVSILDMYNNNFKITINEDVTIEHLAYLIIRGGWPANINTPKDKAHILPKNYIDSLLNKDISDDKKRNKQKMFMLLKSLARNESTLASKKTIFNDINEDIGIESRMTLDDYLDVLNRLHILDDQLAYDKNYRSVQRLGKSSKRHLIDPSLSCSILDLTCDKLINDIKTFGFMFEALVERDLKIYMEYLGGRIYHFRDNVTGLEADAILEFENGDYAIVEIKLGFNEVEDAKKNLLKIYDKMINKPKFMCVVVGLTNIIVKDEETGIYIVPLTALKP